jgi:hypothetical protein
LAEPLAATFPVADQEDVEVEVGRGEVDNSGLEVDSGLEVEPDLAVAVGVSVAGVQE